ncbi:MAG: NADP-dependent isocitrate dehydrogenase, partial [Synergistaceae bacterium]|nr:NADP-dependent isocitrate dehydrogenase [Synergistaceae bacterium]
KRGELDDNGELMLFADKLEKATISTIEGGVMTKDLSGLCEGVVPQVVDSKQFIQAIAAKL